MVQPENFVLGDAKQMIYKLKKSICGLKQASHQWYYKFHQVIISFDFEMNIVDDCIYYKFSGSKYIFLVLYVDDILLANNDIDLLHETKGFLAKKFKMKDLGDASFVLGIQIHFVLGDVKQMIYKLKKSIYGLKQASHQWCYKFHQVIISFGFEMNIVDDCIYHKFSGSKYIFLIYMSMIYCFPIMI